MSTSFLVVVHWVHVRHFQLIEAVRIDARDVMEHSRRKCVSEEAAVSGTAKSVLDVHQTFKSEDSDDLADIAVETCKNNILFYFIAAFGIHED